MATVRGEEPDRTPIMENHISRNVLEALAPSVAAQPEFAELFGLDSVCATPVWKHVQETDDGYIDEWGVRYKYNLEDMAHPIEGPVKTRDDLTKWTPPDPEADWRLGRLEELAARFKGERIVYFHHRADYMWSAYVMGLEGLLISFIEEPELAHELLERVARANEIVARRAVRAGADVVCLADDYAGNTGPMMALAQFDEFLLERYQRLVNAIKEEGGLCMKHCDGNIMPLMDRFLSAPIDMLNPLEPTVGMDIGKVKEQYGDRVTLVGNIDCSHLLTFGEPHDVEEAVKDVIRRAGAGGRLIISSSNSIHSSVKPENFKAMIDATHKWGRYPLELG
jgi:uroporphyrinogen decarboxylase